jgi:hypothetical protein
MRHARLPQYYPSRAAPVAITEAGGDCNGRFARFEHDEAGMLEEIARIVEPVIRPAPDGPGRRR